MAPSPYPTDRYNREGAAGLRARLARGPIVMQGPVVTALRMLPDGEGLPAALWNVAEPQAVARVHELYAAAGAELLVTNTHRASSPMLAEDGVRQQPAEVNRAAVAAARRVPGTYIAGAMGPCGIEWVLEGAASYREARAAYRDQAHQLLAAGADGILLEGFTSLREIEPAFDGVGDVRDGMPLIVALTVNQAGDLPGDDQNIEAAVRYAQDHGAEVIGAACPDAPSAGTVARRLHSITDLPTLVTAAVPGEPHVDEDGLTAWDERPSEIAQAASLWLDSGVSIIGGGWGSTARTACALADLIL